MLILIVLGLIVVGSFAACYFCSQLWHWSQVLLAETVLLLGLAFFFLSFEVLRIQQLYGERNKNNLAKIERLEPLVNALQFGTDDPSIIRALENLEVPVRMADGDVDENGEPIDSGRMLSVRDLDHRLGMVSRARGRVWRNASLGGVDAGTQTITLNVPAPDPHNIKAGSIIYAFQQGEPEAVGTAGPGYVGEFRVSAVAPQQIQIQPAMQLDDQAVQRLGQNQVPWVLYENTPTDQYPDGQLEIFTDATPEYLQKMIPQQSVAEYLRHGTPAQPGDDEWHRTGYDAEGNIQPPTNWGPDTVYFFRRSLRDYNLLYQDYSKVYTQMGVDTRALTADNAQLEKTLASAQKLQTAYQQEQQKLRSDVANVTRDSEAIEAHRKQVTTQLSNALALLQDVIKQNTEFANSME